MAALFGARGGVAIPDADRRGCYSHLSKHYKQFDKEPPEFREYTGEELKEMFFDDQKIIDEIFEKRTEGKIRPLEELMREGYIAYNLGKKIEELKGEIGELKEGRVLSAKNRKLIQTCLVSMEAAIPPLRGLLSATEPSGSEELDLELVEGEPILHQEDKDKLEISEEKLWDIVGEALKNNLGTIAEMIEAKIAKIRGKVE